MMFGTYWSINMKKIDVAINEITSENSMNSEIRSHDVVFTAEQQASVDYRDGALLVSAAAGSGKTKVLVERLLSRIDEQCNIDEFLIITYTRAAAFELRERIYEEILTRLANSPGNNRLRRQAMLCRGASIDTIHTFCSEILRENAHLVKLPPDFRVVDESESNMIMYEAAQILFNDIYDNIEEYQGFGDLVDIVVEGRDDQKLIDVLIDLHKKIQSIPNPQEWIEVQTKKLHLLDVSDISETECGAYILDKLKKTVEYCVFELNYLQNEMNSLPEFKEKYTESIDVSLNGANMFLEALSRGWDDARRFKDVEFQRAKPVKGYEELKEIRTRCSKTLKQCSEDLENSSEEHITDMRLLSPAITILLQLLIKLDSVYSEEKLRRGVADFSDLEHLTLSLLVNLETGEKTELAENISGRFKEIMIDEYQDVNAVQEMIFNAVSDNKMNIFMVGDVKQSIYRFRLADPLIFLSKYSDFPDFDMKNTKKGQKSENSEKSGTKIHLSHNFRSHGSVLNAVNHIFNNIMSTEFGELEYTEKEMLYPGRNDEKGKQGKQGMPYIGKSDVFSSDSNEDNEQSDEREPSTNDIYMCKNDKNNNNDDNIALSVELLDMKEYKLLDPEENPAAIKVEAEYVAGRIEGLTANSCMIPDGKGGFRAAEYSDTVILLRSLKGKAQHFATALAARGIPYELPGEEGFFEELEISAVLSMLMVIDNPVQDIPLAAVLCGPVYSLSAEEMAEISSSTSEIAYYDALKRSAEPDIVSDETSLKCKKILTDINDLRKISQDLPADRFIWHLYNKTGLIGTVSSMRNGEKRKNNIILLAESAGRFEKSGYKGIYGFLTYIENLRERGMDLNDGFTGSSKNENFTGAVKIMSIHKSKGLEFPIVFLANSSKQFNYQDIRKEIVFHKELGIGSMLIDRQRKIKYSTLARDAIRSKLGDEMLSEEVRVLYVALTRARERLILTGTLRDAGNTLNKIQMIPPGKLHPQYMKSLKSMSDWILASTRDGFCSDIKVKVITPDHEAKFEIDYAYDKKPKSSQSAEPNTEIISENDIPEQCYIYNYLYPGAPDLPSKLTVTRLTKLYDPEASSASWSSESTVISSNHRYPSFISGVTAMTPAERGTLLHHVMQHIDYEKGSAEHDVYSEVCKMAEKGFLNEDQVKEIDIEKITRFFKSDIGKRMLKAETVKREFKFSVLRPAELYFSSGENDEILIQGIIDCYFEEDGELIVLDFKTDNVNNETVKERARVYTPQLDVYADALEKILEKRVKERIIYFFAIDKTYYV